MSLKGKEKITLEASKETPDNLEMTGKYSNLYLRDY